MEPAIHDPDKAGQHSDADDSLVPPAHDPYPRYRSELDWLLNRQGGLRAGWVIAIFILLYRLFVLVFGTFAVALDPALTRSDYSPSSALVSELVPFLAMLAAAGMMSAVERRNLTEYNLGGSRRTVNFLFGLAAGFLALSSLVAALAAGGWLHFGPVALTGTGVLKFGALWGCTFLVVGCFEEGIFRCFLLSTLTRSLNFWWALGIVTVVCLDLFMRSRGLLGIVSLLWLSPRTDVAGNGLWGVFAIALLGLFPCFALHLKNAPDSGFWQAAWVTSTVFGFIHTGNNGENWIGIFAAAAIGFVFCVSIWATGSAWWAIGCHAGWDWAETYFYGTADSGLPAQSHYLTTSPAGNVLWSGGTDGPEGSLLVLGTILLLLLAVLAIYGRKRARALTAPATEQLPA
jgi:membrane protease YdiL (CAAX protease family)